MPLALRGGAVSWHYDRSRACPQADFASGKYGLASRKSNLQPGRDGFHSVALISGQSRTRVDRVPTSLPVSKILLFAWGDLWFGLADMQPKGTAILQYKRSRFVTQLPVSY